MAQEFNTTPGAPGPTRRRNTGLIVAIVVLVVLCCCIALAIAAWWLWNNGDALLGVLVPIFNRLI